MGGLTLADSSGNRIGQQWQTEPGVAGAVGIELRLAEIEGGRGRSVEVGLRAEIGYEWQPDFAFDRLTGAGPASPPPSGQQPIASSPLALGGLSTAGYPGHASLYVGF